MKIFIDCEFNGYKGELISMALVTEHKTVNPWYYVFEISGKIDPWVEENVMPILNKEKTDITKAKVLLALWLKQFNEISIIADWPDDIKYFCEFLITGPGNMIETGRIDFIFDPYLSSGESKIPHNALEDALAIRDSYIKRKMTWTTKK